MAKYHFNHNYDGGSPNLPLGIGDRYYGQDLGLDFNCLFEKAGLTLKDIVGSIPIIVSGLIATKGTGNTLNVTAGRGYAEWDITIPTTPWAVPPSTTTQTLEAVRIVTTVQTNMACPSAILDDITVNYIKLRFKENNSDTRTRAKKSGTYAYRLEESFEFIVSPTAPTSKDIVLGSFISVGNNIPPTIDITNRSSEFTNDTFYAGNVFNTDVAIENINALDPVMLTQTGYRKSKFEISNEIVLDSDTESSSIAGICKLDNNCYAVFYQNKATASPYTATCRVIQYVNGTITALTSESNFVSDTSNVSGVQDEYKFPSAYLGSNTFVVTYRKGASFYLYGRVGKFDGVSTITWYTEFVINNTLGGLTLWDMEGLYDNNFAVVYPTLASPITFSTKVGQINLSTGAVTWYPGTALVLPTTNINYPRICPLKDGYYVITYGAGVNPVIYGVLYQFSGSTVTLIVGEKELAEADSSLSADFYGTYLGGNNFVITMFLTAHNIISLCAFSNSNLESLYQEKRLDYEDQASGLLTQKPVKINDNKIAFLRFVQNNYMVTTNATGVYLYILTLSNYTVKIERKKYANPEGAYFYPTVLNDNLLAVVFFRIPALYTANSSVIKIPKYSGIATESKTVGQNIIVQHKGILNGFTGLLKGKKYFNDTQNGTIDLATESNYDDFLAGEALSDTKLLLK